VLQETIPRIALFDWLDDVTSPANGFTGFYMVRYL